MVNVKPEAYVSWLHRTTINQSITHLRKARKNPHIMDDEIDFRAGEVETSRSPIYEMKEIIEKLPPIHQVVLGILLKNVAFLSSRTLLAICIITLFFLLLNTHNMGNVFFVMVSILKVLIDMV